MSSTTQEHSPQRRDRYGETTFTKALADLIPLSEHHAVIEDTRELKIEPINIYRWKPGLKAALPTVSYSHPPSPSMIC
jgi:hypothetical protein